MIVYVIEMVQVYEQPTLDPHKYVLGAYSDTSTAKLAAKAEIKYRTDIFTYKMHVLELDYLSTEKVNAL